MLAQQQLQADYEKVRVEDSEKSNKLQELMSVDNIDFKQQRSVLPLLAPPPPAPINWVEFMPYKIKTIDDDNINLKSDKDRYNSRLVKNTRSQYALSIFHIHAFHLQLFISLTLILVTHKCPNYVIILD